ncbi:MAG: TonB-dependent receptor [Acidobacteria bacterium]|nr:TonB-dependent receptor [Acidobacteriota bacterium]
MCFPRISVWLVCLLLLLSLPALGQSPNGNINGLILDPTNRAIAGAEILAVNDVNGVQFATRTNGEGVYVLANLPPGPYRIQVSKAGFKTVIKPDITLNVQDALSINFTMPVGATLETVTVEGGAPLVDTESAAVSTVVNREFAENLPMNGRSFQTLIQLTPGVVATPSNVFDPGQFSVNGQRTDANYWMVDGVSANIGVGVSSIGSAGVALGGTVGSFSAQGGTNSIASIDALQEFRIQTSGYAPEFGRTPGAQVSIVTRSGTNQFHGTAFDYLRNDALDANDWFASQAGLRKPEERQNDFGGTLGGPLRKNESFFFFSYEGLRLRLPQVGQTSVPGPSARQNAAVALQPFLNAYPVPNGAEDPATGAAPFNASFSNSATLDAYSLRIDHHFNSKSMFFGRYNHSPSELVQRGVGLSLNTVGATRILTQTLTLGNTWAISPAVFNDLRFNYSRVNATGSYFLDDFGGADPLSAVPIPDSVVADRALFIFSISGIANGGLAQGTNGQFTQHQINVVDNTSFQKGTHAFKVGVDFRRLSPDARPRLYVQDAGFLNVAAAQNGDLFFSDVTSGVNTGLLFRNLGLFAQDSWKVIPRLTLTYGLRWDVDFTPTALQGPGLPAVSGFDLKDFSGLSLSPSGTSAFHTIYTAFAPRFGIAYSLSNRSPWQSVFRGGFGLFYNLASAEVGNLYQNGVAAYPFGAERFSCCFNGTFPLNPATAAPPTIDPANLSTGVLFGLDPNLKPPYTLQWNVAFEQGLDHNRSITLSYVGAAGRRLMQSGRVNSPNADFGAFEFVTNSATSDYHALQAQFQQRLSRGLQVLASYALSHSIDTASAGTLFGNEANALIPGTSAQANRASSDFDIRNALSGALTYDVPAFASKGPAFWLLGGWSVENILQSRSAPPVNIYYSNLGTVFNFFAQVRPDVVPEIPLYLYGDAYPGGKIINNTPDQAGTGCIGAFCPPPLDTNGAPLRQGTLGRNALRGFGAAQWDFAVHRDFPIRDSIKLQFRAELFNVLNHPNFGQPISDLNNSAQFGRSTQMLGRSFDQSSGSGSFSALYQIGGPRSVQLALKLFF